MQEVRQNLHFWPPCEYGNFHYVITYDILGCVRTVKKVNNSFVACCLGGFSSLFVSPLAKITLLDSCLILTKDQCIAVFKLNKPDG